MREVKSEKSPRTESTIVSVDIDLESANYMDSIRELRTKLADNPSNRKKVEEYSKSHNNKVPNFTLLAEKQAFGPKRWMYITLSVGKPTEDGARKKVTLAVRDDNVYFMAFRKQTGQNENGPWYQFAGEEMNNYLEYHRNPQKKIEKTQESPITLGFKSNYGQLLGRLTWDQVTLGREAAKTAVGKLYNYDPRIARAKDIQLHVAKLIVMICESARMDLHMERVATNWSLCGSMIEREVLCLNLWDKMSEAMLGYVSYQYHGRLIDIGITNHTTALKVVHLMNNSPKGATESLPSVYADPPNDGDGSPTGPGSENTGSGDGGGGSHPGAGGENDGGGRRGGGGGGRYPGAGSENSGGGAGNGSSSKSAVGDGKHAYNRRCLLEVFALCASGDIASLKSIAVFDGKHGQMIYRNEGNGYAPSTDRKGNLVLMGPYTAISAGGRVGLRISTVTETNTDEDDFVIWNPYDEKPYYDELLSCKVTPDLKLTYAVFSSAVKATVQVDLFLFRETDFNGEITAQSYFESGEEASVVLFREDKLHLKPKVTGSTIQLKRSVVAWSLARQLGIKVACFHFISFVHHAKKYRTKEKINFFSTEKRSEGTSGSATTTTLREGLEFSFHDTMKEKVQCASLEGFGYMCVSVDHTVNSWEKPKDSLRRSLLMNQFKIDKHKETTKATDIDTIFTIPSNGTKKVTIKAIVSSTSDKTSTSEARGNVPVTESSTDQSSLLHVYPLQLDFAFKDNKVMCCPIRLNNMTDDYVIFKGLPCTPELYLNGLDYFKGILPPRSTCTYVVNMQKMGRMPDTMDALPVTLKSCAAEMTSEAAPDTFGQAIMHVVTPKAICDEEEPTIPNIKAIMTKGNCPAICSMDVHPDEPWILAGHKDGMVSIWNYETQEKIRDRTLSFNRIQIWSAKFIGRMGWFVVGVDHGNITVLDYKTWSIICKDKAAHSQSVNSLAVHPNPNKDFVLSASGDGLIKLWKWEEVKEDAKTTFRLQCLRERKGHPEGVRHVVFNPDGNTFTCVYNTIIEIWATDDFTLVKSFGGTSQQKNADYFSLGNQQYMTIGSSGGHAHIWDLKTNKLIKVLEGYHSSRNCANEISDNKNIFFHKNPFFITASEGFGVSILDATTYEPRHVINVNFGLGEAHGFAHVEVYGNKSLVLIFSDGIAIMEFNEYPVNAHVTVEQSQEGASSAQSTNEKLVS